MNEKTKYKNSKYGPVKFQRRVLCHLKRKLPILEWLPKYDRLTAFADGIAGLTLGLTLVPQSIAYASLAGLPVQYGLYSAFIGTMLYAFFGTVKEVSIGPTSLMALLTYATCKDLDIEHVILLTFLSGCGVLIMGLLRLGFLVDLISLPVTSGFTSATAVIIIVTQLKGILGLSFHAESVIDNFVNIVDKFNEIKINDTILALCCCIVLLLMRKVKDLPANSQSLKKTLWLLSISRNAIVVFLTLSLAAYFFYYRHYTPVLLSGDVAPGLPKFNVPPFGYTKNNETVTFLKMCQNLGSSIGIVPLTMVLANIAIAKAFSTGGRVDATQEMITLGFCNILGSFFHSMPTTGAFTRSAVSNSSGVKTPFSGIYSGTITLIALCFLTPYFCFIPKATLSSILVCAVIFMIDYEMAIKLWKTCKQDFFLLILTFFVCLFTSVEVALFVGVIANLSLLIYSWARPAIFVDVVKTSTGGKYLKFQPGVGLFYLNIEYFKLRFSKAAARQGENMLPLVVDCSKLQAVDHSACEGLGELVKKYESSIQKIIFFNASSDIIEKLKKFDGIEDRYFAQSEPELLEIMFYSKEEFGKIETMPLLADSFRKKESIGEYGVRYEMSNFSSSRSCETNDQSNKD